MLKVANALHELSFSGLMEVYAEGNRENGLEMYPDEPEARQLQLAEEGFYQYLHDTFFPVRGARYAVWVEQGRYVSALRLEPYRDGLLLEALETLPDRRRQGYAAMLIQAVQALPGMGKIYSHVSKRNLPSQAVHKKCGFRVVADQAVYIDGSVNSRAVTFCWEQS